MLATLVIVFREVIEAGLIIGIVLAATKGVPQRGLWVGYGITGGIVGACMVAVFAGSIAGLFEGSGQELFNASVLLLAVFMLTWHNVWMAGHGRQMAENMRVVGADVVAGKRSLMALAVVIGVAVLREGSEIVLFLYGIGASGSTSSAALLAGGAIGIGGGAALSTLMYFGLLAVPTRNLFAVTSGLITLLAAGLAAQAVYYFQQAGHFRVLTSTVWNSDWLLTNGSLVGKLMHTLVGYTARPNGAQLLVYVATIVVIVGLMRMVGRKSSPASPASSPVTAGD